MASKKNPNISYDEACRKYSYDSLTGELINRQTGRPYTAKGNNGGLLVSVKGRTISLHRLAWFLHHGYWPEKLIRHKDGDPTNNAIDNLEQAGTKLPMQEDGKRAMPTFKEMAESFEYCPQRGTIIRKRTGKPCESYIVSGGKRYLAVRYHGRAFFLHRVVWLLVTGFWPDRKLVHKDGDPENNRFDNLEELL